MQAPLLPRPPSHSARPPQALTHHGLASRAQGSDPAAFARPSALHPPSLPNRVLQPVPGSACPYHTRTLALAAAALPSELATPPPWP